MSKKLKNHKRGVHPNMTGIFANGVPENKRAEIRANMTWMNKYNNWVLVGINEDAPGTDPNEDNVILVFPPVAEEFKQLRKKYEIEEATTKLQQWWAQNPNNPPLPDPWLGIITNIAAEFWIEEHYAEAEAFVEAIEQNDKK